MKVATPALVLVVASIAILVEVGVFQPRKLFVSTGQNASDGQGTSLSSLVQKVRNVQTRTERPSLLIVAPPCGSCVTRHFTKGKEIRKDYAYVFVIESSGGKEPHEAGLTYLKDPTGEMARKLNALLPPRAYELDGSYNVVRAECEGDDPPLVRW